MIHTTSSQASSSLRCKIAEVLASPGVGFLVFCVPGMGFITGWADFTSAVMVWLLTLIVLGLVDVTLVGRRCSIPSGGNCAEE